MVHENEKRKSKYATTILNINIESKKYFFKKD